MPAAIKAIVFKTPQMKATRHFFENILQLPVKESSARHFVIHSKTIRLVFVESVNDFELELYINDKSDHLAKQVQTGVSNHEFSTCKDPNGISVVITGRNKWSAVQNEG